MISLRRGEITNVWIHHLRSTPLLRRNHSGKQHVSSTVCASLAAVLISWHHTFQGHATTTSNNINNINDNSNNNNNSISGSHQNSQQQKQKEKKQQRCLCHPIKLSRAFHAKQTFQGPFFQTLEVICTTLNLEEDQTVPIASMHGIFTYIWLIFMVNVREIYHTWMLFRIYK